MEFRLFGEVRLVAAGRFLDVGAPRQQAVLAALAVDAGRPVPIEAIVDRVWGDEPPAEARNVLYSHLSRLRHLLRQTGEPAAIERRTAGYLLDVPPETVDLHRFAALVQTGRAAALAEALRLWHGPPLAGIGGEWADNVRTAWHRRRLDALVQWGELQLRLGHAGEVAATVADLTAEYPLAERLEAILLRALLADGRGAEALERYGEVRRRLADELGTEPGPELRALHATMLAGAAPVPAAAPNHTVVTPAQLPPDVRGFAGREAELHMLDELQGGGPVVLSGTAGVGKTTLAVHWSHRVRGAFPGGQLYVNLRGFDPGGAPVTPAQAVRDFLDALDVPASRRPSSLEAQIGLYRSLLADRRLLVVLDNARDAGQVRPLLPGAPGCQVLVTSRDELVGLVAEGARPVPLDLLGTEEAHAVLRERLGRARVDAEPAAVAEIAELCARLPLALAVVAARAATRPAFRLADLAGQLRAARGGLDEFAGADPATDPRAVFSWSYLRLSPAAARLFRLLGLHPGPDAGVRAALALDKAARPALAELTQAHLLTEVRPGRYACHDLLRSYAAELVAETDGAEERAAATQRLLAYYRHSAYLADGFIDPRREVPPEPAPLPEGVEPERIVTHAEALAWFTAERPVLLRAVHQPPRFDREVWELVWASRRFLALQGHWHDGNAVLGVALEAARRLDDGLKQAFAHCFLGCTGVWLDRYDEAGEQLDAALALYAAGGDRIGQAYTQHYWAWLLERQERPAEALAHAERALELFGAAGHRAGQAKARNAVGWLHALLGDHTATVHHCRQALALQQELGDGLGAAQTWHSLGFAYSAMGDDTQAILCYKSAEDLFHRSGYLFNEALVLTASADIHASSGRHDQARADLRRAYDILRRLGHPTADEVRAKLEDSHD
ncbi:BTAD domain-containing putative transcriptional regulator [Dactylosporangium sp. NPDC049140]|uniref:AfsR/SARP family transcriptional regulator n=1 Tax=Dactylosporangium sp. NPDC049140 TaxID=3155647 RepID=UPI0033FD7D0D